MNNLNSILIEGTLTRDPELATIGETMEPSCLFTIGVKRLAKKANGGLEADIATFDVRTSGRLAEVCKEYLSKGRGVRVVGRLAQEKSGEAKILPVYIFAEHVEFKPQLKKE